MAKAKKVKEVKEVKEEVVVGAPLDVEIKSSGDNTTMIVSEELINEINGTVWDFEKYPLGTDSVENKILEFASNEFKRANDFLISLYSEKLADDMSTNKIIKETLADMVNKGEIEIASNRHMDLAMTYYDEEARSQKHNILNTDIFIKK